MNEDQLRAGLRAAVADEPPLGFDPDRAAEHARRTVRRRRAVFASTAGTFLAVAAMVATVTLLGSPGSSIPGLPPPSDDTSGRVDINDVAAHFAEVLPDVVPGAYDVEVAYQDALSDGFARFELMYSDANGVGLLEFTFDIPNGVSPCDPNSEVIAYEGCEIYPRSDGTEIRIGDQGTPGNTKDFSTGYFQTGIPDGLIGDARVRQAHHGRPDKIVYLLSYRFDREGSDHTGRDDVLLTDEQLIELVTDPVVDQYGAIAPTTEGLAPEGSPSTTAPDVSDEDRQRLATEAARIGDHIAASWPNVVPGAAEIDVHVDSLVRDAESYYVYGAVTYRDADGPTVVTFSVFFESSEDPDILNECPAGFEGTCQIILEDAGNVMLIGDAADSEPRALKAMQFHDEALVIFTTVNALDRDQLEGLLVVDDAYREVYDEVVDALPSDSAPRDDVALTEDQLVELVTGQELHLTR